MNAIAFHREDNVLLLISLGGNLFDQGVFVNQLSTSEEPSTDSKGWSASGSRPFWGISGSGQRSLFPCRAGSCQHQESVNKLTEGWPNGNVTTCHHAAWSH